MNVDIVREAITSSFIGLDLYLTVTLAVYLAAHIQQSWTTTNRFAAALLLVFIGRGCSRVWGWLVFRSQFAGAGQYPADRYFWLSLAGSFIQMVGILMLVQIITPPRWGRAGWIGALACAGIFFVVSRLI